MEPPPKLAGMKPPPAPPPPETLGGETKIAKKTKRKMQKSIIARPPTLPPPPPSSSPPPLPKPQSAETQIVSPGEDINDDGKIEAEVGCQRLFIFYSEHSKRSIFQYVQKLVLNDAGGAKGKEEVNESPKVRYRMTVKQL